MWYYLYDVNTGELRSESSAPPQNLPANTQVLQIATRVDRAAQIWDPATHAFVPRPVVAPSSTAQSIDTLIAKPTAQWNLQDVATALKLFLAWQRQQKQIS